MIPQYDIIEWSNYVSWQTTEQVEQDLVICPSLVETKEGVNSDALIQCYKRYITFSDGQTPTQKQFIQN